jgi:peptide/nickel transport system substrate-binding protein
MNILPGLAESWTNLDERTTQFKLRKGVKFHNGEELKAEDVKYSFERMMKSPRISFVLPPLEKVEVVDDYTINLVTKTPFGPLLSHLSHPALGIVNKKMMEKDPEGLKHNPVGTGPYKFSNWRAGDRVTLVRNDEYFMEPAQFEKLIIRNIPEASNRTIALETGEVDLSLSVSAIDEETIKNHPKLKLLTKPSISYTYVGMNNKKEIFQNEKVRKAVNYAIDKQAIVDVVLNGSGKVTNSPIAPAVFGFTDKTKNYEYNLEKAKELMKEAGYEKGFKANIYSLGGEADRQTAEIIQANLKEIGIDLAINVVENSAYWDQTDKGMHDLFLGSWGCVTGDADYGLYALYHSSSFGMAGNRSFYSNPEVDKLLDAAKNETDQEKRKELYERIQLIIVDEAPEVMLYNRVLSVGAQKNIEGFNMHPVTLHDFYPIYVK